MRGMSNSLTSAEVTLYLKRHSSQTIIIADSTHLLNCEMVLEVPLAQAILVSAIYKVSIAKARKTTIYSFQLYL